MSRVHSSLSEQEQQRREQFIELLRSSTEPVPESQALEDFQPLSSDETSAIWTQLQRELQQAPANNASAINTSNESTVESVSWLQWLGDWLFPLATVPALALLALWMTPVKSQNVTPSGVPGVHSTYTGVKSASKGAYLMIHTLKAGDLLPNGQQDTSKSRPLVSGQSYPLGDAFLFRFLMTRSGYVTLLREGKDGKLEQLYPFPKQAPRRFAAGERVKLSYKGQQMLYVLDSSLQGEQQFHLVYSKKPRTFARHRRELTTSGRALLVKADHLRVVVRPRQ